MAEIKTLDPQATQMLEALKRLCKQDAYRRCNYAMIAEEVARHEKCAAPRLNDLRQTAKVLVQAGHIYDGDIGFSIAPTQIHYTKSQAKKLPVTKPVKSEYRYRRTDVEFARLQ